MKESQPLAEHLLSPSALCPQENERQVNYESWIWTELLAFDNASPDQGVAAYVERLGFAPTGISLMASASDFVMLHAPLTEDRPLFADVCTRFGHAGNEERARQDWTAFQLRSLIANLRARGIAVFVSVFAAYHHDAYHREWLSDHPEARIVYDHMGVTDGVQVLARLSDGTYYEDLFVPQLVQVMQDYGFDGWHGPDCLGPAGSLGHSDCSDGMIAQFAEYLGEQCPPELERVTGHEIPRLQTRMQFIWRCLYREWIEFNMGRWERFWGKIVAALKPLGVRTMINSANTKAAFESMYHQGMDYRRIAKMGVDYLVVETVAANLALINGGHERHFDFAATLAEMKALAPEMKLIFLHGVKDVTESYDLLRHAPGRLEREVFTLSNQFIRDPQGQLQRCATGFMVCLGDGLHATDWEYLRGQWHTGFSFAPIRAGGLTWVWSEATVDCLLADYPLHGTWPGYRQVAHLVETQGLQIHQICRIENLAQVTGPILVPNADLLSESERRALADYTGGPVVLLGKAPNGDESGRKVAAEVTCPVSEGYVMGCLVWDNALSGAQVGVSSPTEPGFSDMRPPLAFWDRPDQMPIPAEFWDCAGQAIRDSVAAWEQVRGLTTCQALNPQEGLRLMTLENAAGVSRTALVSCIPTYLVPQFRFTAPPTAIRKISNFPYTPLAVSDATVCSGHNQSPLHIPPYGIIVMDVGFVPEA